MYSHEEEELERHKQAYDHVKVPHELIDKHIEAGFMKAKNENKRTYKTNWLIAAAISVVLLVGFVSTIQIIDHIRDNKGLIAAIEHDYYEEIGESIIKDDVELIVDGAITDEKGMVLFYTINSTEKRDRMRLQDFELTGVNGEDLGIETVSYGHEKTNKKDRSFSGMIEVFFEEPSQVKEFKMEAKITGSSFDGTFESSFADEFTIPFKLEEDILAEETIELDETVVINDQKMTFTKVIITPIRTMIHVEMDEQNTKKILNFEDLRLVDEHGEIWGKILNGVTARTNSDNETIIYLQSNYFSEPTELYIEMNSIQAIDKTEALVVVDPETEEIVKQPKGNVLTNFKVEHGYLVFQVDIDEDHSEYDININVGFSNLYNEAGESIPSSSSYGRKEDKNTIEVGVAIDDLNELHGLISLEIAFFPLEIDGDINIQIK